MKRLAVIILLGIVSAAALTGAACGGDGDDDDGAQANATGTIVSGDVPTPFPTPQVTGNEAVSESKGYSATFPEGWRPRFNLIQTADASADVYFEPLQEGAEVQASITVNCLLEQPLANDERIVAEQTSVARLGLNENIEVGTVQIAGQEATSIRYTTTSQQNPDQPRLDKVDIFFGGELCDYTVTTTVLEGTRDQYQPMFDTFVQSFQLLN